MYCRYITCNTSYDPFFTSACVLAIRCRNVAWVVGRGVNICVRFKNKLWGWGERVLWPLWPRVSWILRLSLMCNGICFTNVCLELSLKIIIDKCNTTLSHVFTEQLNRTVCTEVALWIGAGDTPDIQNVFISSLSSADKLRLIIPWGSYWNFFLFPLCRPNYQGL